MKVTNEAALQRTIISMLRTLYPRLVINLSLNGISLNGLSSAQKALIINEAKSQGMEPGIPDFALYLPNCIVLNFELKTSTGKQSPEQVAMQNKLESLNHYYYLVNDLYSIFDIIAEHTEPEFRYASWDSLAIPSEGIRTTAPFLHFPVGTDLLEVHQLLYKLYHI